MHDTATGGQAAHLYFCSSRSSSSMRPCSTAGAAEIHEDWAYGRRLMQAVWRPISAALLLRTTHASPPPQIAMQTSCSKPVSPPGRIAPPAHQLLAGLCKLHLEPHRPALLRLERRARLLRCLQAQRAAALVSTRAAELPGSAAAGMRQYLG